MCAISDSLIYEYLKALGDPLEELGGDHLGDWKIEVVKNYEGIGNNSFQLKYPEYEIIEYVSGGSKAYALWLRHKVTGEIKYVIRCRGITLDCRNSEKLTYERFKEQCLNFGSENNYTELEKKEKNFIRDKRGEIYTFHTSKKYEPRVSKGHVNDDFRVLPFGYSNPIICARDNPYPCSCKK
jgi:Zn-finger nucleic acid-binding protein